MWRLTLRSPDLTANISPRQPPTTPLFTPPQPPCTLRPKSPATMATAGRRRRRRLEVLRIKSAAGEERMQAEPTAEISVSLAEEYGGRGGGHGAVSVCGRRRDMEDAVAVALGFSGGHDFFGVYDGHGGGQVAAMCRERLHTVVAEEIRRRGGAGWKEVMEAGFGRMDGEVCGVEGMKMVGSTAVVAVVAAAEVVVANCGDSRAVMGRGGKVLPLSSDHKPNRPDEMERVEAGGGRVINWNGPRVLGVLATSRSIGDHYLKPYVISVPEVTVVERTDADEFLVLASDGLWDVVTSEEACKVVRRCLAGRLLPKSVLGAAARGGPAEAAALLVEFALGRGSSDNVSVVVVDLRRLDDKIQ